VNGHQDVVRSLHWCVTGTIQPSQQQEEREAMEALESLRKSNGAIAICVFSGLKLLYPRRFQHYRNAGDSTWKFGRYVRSPPSPYACHKYTI
jgi:hypothetical protein